MNQADPAWGPRRPKSAFRLWSRYVFQWFWGALYALGLFVLPVVSALLDALHDASGRPRSRPPRRVWLSLARLRRERTADVARVEARLRERITGHPDSADILQIDDSHYRQIGATRALQIAGEYGWHLPEDSLRHAPRWLVLRRGAQPPDHRAPAHGRVTQSPAHALAADGAPYTPIPVEEHAVAGEMGPSIRLWGGDRRQPPVARIGVEPRQPGTTGRTSREPFTLYGGPDGGPLCSVRPAGPGSYDVLAADGTALARVTRRPGRLLLGPRRVRWTVEPAGTAPPFTGRVGTWYAWGGYYVTFPLWAVVWVCAAVYSLVNGEGDDIAVTGPSRTRWRAPGTGTAMEYRGLDKVYRIDPRHLDARIAYAQAYLHARDR